MARKTSLIRIGLCAGLILARAFGQSCISFPSGFIPFSSIDYVTAADSAGDHLVVGVPAAGILSALNAIPLPSSPNQTFCDAQVQLGPQQFYPNVYVPTSMERAGIFSAFAGLLLNPATNQPYPQGVIPASQLNSVFAWRIAAAQAPSTNKTWSPTGSMTSQYGGPAAVLLPNGKVLVVGGFSPVVGSGATFGDIYDPASGSFGSAGMLLFNEGPSLTATLLNDGRVLIVGGTNSAAEFYDPSSGQFLAAPSTLQVHGPGRTATLLKDGRVLIVGGLNVSGGSETGSSSGAEVYDPQSGAFALTGRVNR